MMQKVQSNHEVAVLVVSCDAYCDLWGPFFGCFFKYWPDCPFPIYLGSNLLTYPDKRVRTLPIGDDIDYSSNLIKMLHKVESRWVILWIDDRVLSSPVQTPRLTGLIRSAVKQDAGYFKLIANHPYGLVKDRTQEMGIVPKGTPYRVSITVALWQKHLLQKLLFPGETAWDIERKGSLRSNAFDELFFSLSYRIKNHPPIHDVHLVAKGRLTRGSLAFLDAEGLRSHLRKRILQTHRSHLYGKAYIAAKDLFSYLRLNLSRFRNMDINIRPSKNIK